MNSNLKILKELKVEFARRGRKRFRSALVFISDTEEKTEQTNFVSKLERYFDEVKVIPETNDWLVSCKKMGSESVDQAFILSGLEQCSDPFRLVTEVWRLLALNGRFRISFKNARSVKSRLEFLTGNIDRYSYRGTLKNVDKSAIGIHSADRTNVEVKSSPVFHRPYDLKNVRDLCRSAGFYVSEHPSEKGDQSFVKHSVSNFLTTPLRVVLKRAVETAKEKSEIDVEKRMDLGFR